LQLNVYAGFFLILLPSQYFFRRGYVFSYTIGFLYPPPPPPHEEEGNLLWV
jgi:hypothetical protein